uniref:Uncharacterized protein n=1 Tax=Neobacillus citreus TaxID=2833578 RepID=A0A942SYA3_9BACI
MHLGRHAERQRAVPRPEVVDPPVELGEVCPCAGHDLESVELGRRAAQGTLELRGRPVGHRVERTDPDDRAVRERRLDRGTERSGVVGDEPHVERGSLRVSSCARQHGCRVRVAEYGLDEDRQAPQQCVVGGTFRRGTGTCEQLERRRGGTPVPGVGGRVRVSVRVRKGGGGSRVADGRAGRGERCRASRPWSAAGRGHASWFCRTACRGHAQRERLPDRRARAQVDGEGLRQRCRVGLVGRIGPVALVLHLEDVAPEVESYLPASRVPGVPGDVTGGLVRGDVDRVGRRGLGPVGVPDHERHPGEVRRVQDHEADAVPPERRGHGRRDVHVQRVTVSAGVEGPAQHLGVVEARGRVDPQVAAVLPGRGGGVEDDVVGRAPVRVAGDEPDAAEHGDAVVVPDVRELGAAEREPPRADRDLALLVRPGGGARHPALRRVTGWSSRRPRGRSPPSRTRTRRSPGRP